MIAACLYLRARDHARTHDSRYELSRSTRGLLSPGPDVAKANFGRRRNGWQEGNRHDDHRRRQRHVDAQDVEG